MIMKVERKLLFETHEGGGMDTSLQIIRCDYKAETVVKKNVDIFNLNNQMTVASFTQIDNGEEHKEREGNVKDTGLGSSGFQSLGDKEKRSVDRYTHISRFQERGIGQFHMHIRMALTLGVDELTQEVHVE